MVTCRKLFLIDFKDRVLCSASLSLWWPEEYKELILLICFVCILLSGDIFLHFAIHLTKRGERGNLYPWSVNRNRPETLQSADSGNKHEGGVNRWQNIFWQRFLWRNTDLSDALKQVLLKCRWKTARNFRWEQTNFLSWRKLSCCGKSREYFFFFPLSFVLLKEMIWILFNLCGDSSYQDSYKGYLE